MKKYFEKHVYKESKWLLSIFSVSLLLGSGSAVAAPGVTTPEKVPSVYGSCPPTLPPIKCPALPPVICEECKECPVVPECPTPTPTPPPTVPPTPTPTPTPPPTPPPTPTPTPEPVCEYGKLDVRVTNPASKFDNKKYSYDQFFQGTSSLNEIPCLKTLRDQIWNTKTHLGKEYHDDYKGAAAANMFNSGLGCSIRGKMVHSLHKLAQNWKDLCLAGTWIVDKSCKAVNPKDINPAQICDNLNVTWSRSTPISLIWGDAAAVSSGVPVFTSLDLSGENTWVLWKGSETSPLLVFDPEKTGRVSSPAQLFGEWTFGGQQTASLAGSASLVQPKPWKHGYEALATLDTNNNGKIDGEELSSLSVWFDKNRNAISEEGELVSATDLGITAIYYAVGESVEGGLARDINLATGYERVNENGSTVIGASVDWYTPKLTSPAEAMQYLGATTMLEESRYDSVFMQQLEELTKEAHAKAKSSDSITGNWHWRIEDETQDSGYFAFVADEDNGDFVAGYSLTQRNIPGDEGNALLSALFLKGKKSVNKNGYTELTLNSAIVGGLQTTSTAILSKDGKSMKGKTLVKGDNFGELSTTEYSWTAVRE